MCGRCTKRDQPREPNARTEPSRGSWLKFEHWRTEMKNDYSIGLFVTAFIVMLILVVIGPLLVIWALNTLFPVLAIPYDVWTWLAVVLLAGLFKTRLEYKRD
jgi:hypothetical protein